MKAIVTGAAGFIGSHICKTLVENGHSILGIDDLSTGHVNNCLPSRDGNFLLSKVENTIEDMVKYEPDVIFHLAAIPRVSYSVEHPYETTKSNIMSMLAVLEAARKLKNTRVVYSSSSSIYGGADQLPTPESYPPNPKSPYALQKWQCEEWAQLYAKLYGVDVCCLRYFNAFGTNCRYGGSYTTVIGAWMYSLFVDSTVVAFQEGDGTQTRDFCYIDNIVQANLLAAEYNGKFSGDAFNIGHGSKHSLLQVKDLLELISRHRLHLDVRPPRVGDVDYTLADISKAQKVLGYKPIDDFEGQMRIMAEWYKTDYRQEIETENA